MSEQGRFESLTRRELLVSTAAAGLWSLSSSSLVFGSMLQSNTKPDSLYGVPEDRLGATRTQAYRVGLEVTATGGPCGGLFATVPIPVDWPEQKIRLDHDDFSAQVKQVAYRQLDCRVKQMMVSIPFLPVSETARAVLHLSIERAAILPPVDTSTFHLPKKLPKSARGSLGTSPLIETRNSKIRDQAKTWLKEDLQNWKLVETIYDWVREKTTVIEGKPKGAASVLEKMEGYHGDITALFVALCRASKVPARMVWGPRSSYAEFMLESTDTERPQWLPCRVVGQRELGGISEYRPILQKGDEVRVPEKKQPQRFVAEFMRGKKLAGGGRPKVRFIRESN